MGTGNTWVSSGLIFLSARNIDIVEAGNRISTTFEAMQQRVTQVRILSESNAQIKTRSHQVRMTLMYDQAVNGISKSAKVVLSLQIVRRTRSPGEDTINCDTVLAQLLRSLHKSYYADYVIWAGHEVVLSSKEFLQASAPADKPERILHRPGKTSSSHVVQPKHPALAQQQIDECSARLDHQLRHNMNWANADAGQDAVRTALMAPPEDIQAPAVPEATAIREPTAPLRLSAWFMSMSVALLCLPVGVMLIVVNLLRGENLRLANQAAALTGTFMALQAFGSVAQAATVLQTVLN